MNKLLLAFVLFVVALVFVGFAAAGSYYYPDDNVNYYKEQISKTYYNSNEDSALTRTIYVNYNNEDRYSTYDYRNGYSYRDSEDYWNRMHDFDDYNDVRVVRVDDNRNRNMHNSYGYYNDDVKVVRADRNMMNRRYSYRYDNDDFFRMDNGYGDWNYADQPRTQVRYIPYLDTYETRHCYDYAPRGKLFYVRCE